jgi:hypothetical protein
MTETSKQSTEKHWEPLRLLVVILGVSLLAGTFSPAPAQVNPSMTGTWVRNPDKSEDPKEKIRSAAQDMFDKTTKGGRNVASEDIPRIQKRLRSMISSFVQHAEILEIEHDSDELHVDDGEGRVRIFYIDGEKHVRQTPGGAKLETVCRGQGSQIFVEQKLEGAKIFETYAMSADGERLTLTVRMEAKRFKKPLTLRNVYDREQ